jgi:diadenosine tetraphosphate (Ap4A) HIT family hydrolase
LAPCERVQANDFAAERATAVAFPDAFPLTPGHTLVVPRRHLIDLSQFEPLELSDLWLLATSPCRDLQRERGVSAFNLGVNLGRAAGQTVEHVHLHVIPRYEADVGDPRGGIRWIIPERAWYSSGSRVRPTERLVGVVWVCPSSGADSGGTRRSAGLG